MRKRKKPLKKTEQNVKRHLWKRQIFEVKNIEQEIFEKANFIETGNEYFYLHN